MKHLEAILSLLTTIFLVIENNCVTLSPESIDYMLMNITISMNTVLNFLHSMALSTSNKRWLADHLYEEIRAEEKAVPVVKVKRKLTEKEKDELFEKMVGIWKDDPIGDKVIEAIRIGRQPVGYERKLAYIDEDE